MKLKITPYLNDCLDIFFVFIGLIIPLGDWIETPISFILDIIVFLKIRKKSKLAPLILIFENFDILDLVFNLSFDIGVLELLPSWSMLNKYIEAPDEIKPISAEYPKINTMPIPITELTYNCACCGQEIEEGESFCLFCGTKNKG